jgi:two-component system response regulator GlrR
MPKPVVLCADDAPSFLLAWTTLLQSQGLSVLTANTGNEALQVFRSHAIDLALLDYHMPDMNGDVVAKEIRASKADIPIALLSSEGCVPEAALETVDAFISKDEPTTRLLEIVQHLLSLRNLFQPLAGLRPDRHRKAA